MIHRCGTDFTGGRNAAHLYQYHASPQSRNPDRFALDGCEAYHLAL
ncbi:hypothetical protein VARIO8X_110153 [Burkholderiales bacterium 8X]|nr:hypothetical protein VARIO8X_110153 [Burkholderiales bacterium 8X]